MIDISIACINANGLSDKAVDDILFYCTNIDLLFITETWLLPNTSLPTTWKQYHVYGEQVQNSFRGQMGTSLLVNPNFAHKNNIYVNTNTSKYLITCKIFSTTIHCIYLPPTPSLTDVEAYSLLQAIPLLQQPNTIICGDFNARLGPHIMGDSRWNSRGSKLMKWVNDHGLLNLNRTLGQKGVPTYMRFQNNQTQTSIIDYFFSTSELLEATLQIRVDLGFSDHKMLHLTFKLEEPTENLQDTVFQRQQWQIHKLQDPAIVKLYNKTVQQSIYGTKILAHLHPLLSHVKSVPLNEMITEEIQESIEYYADIIYDKILYSSLDTVLGKKEFKQKHWKWFWNKDLQRIANTRQQYYSRWRKTFGLDKIKWWTLYIKEQHHLKCAVKQARNRAYHNFCDTLDQDLNYQPTVKRILKAKQSDVNGKYFQSPQGPQHATNQMAEFLKEIYSGKNLVHPDTNTNPDQNAIITNSNTSSTNTTSPTPTTSYDESDALDTSCPFTFTSTRQGIKRLPNNKSPGSDHIIAEHLHPINITISPLLTIFFQICYFTAYTPAKWRIAQTIPIYKKGEKQDPANYRPISLTSTFRKLMEYGLKDTLYDHTTIDTAQGGFKPQLCAVDQALCLDTLIQQYKQQHAQSCPTILLMDICKAYDVADRRIIWKELYDQQVPPRLIMLLQNMFDKVHLQIINNNHQSHSFSIYTGLLQGSVLSPHLYSIFINSLTTAIRSNILNTNNPNTNQSFSYPHINTLLFADDVACLGTETEIHQILSTMETHSMQLGYRWSPPKCQVIKSPTPTVFRMYGEIIQEYTSVTYLGLPFNKDGLDAQQFLEKTHKSIINKMHTLSRIGARPNAFTIPLSVKLYKTFIRPKIEYGLAILNFNKKQITRLERIQDDCLRMIVGGKSTSSMKAFRVMINIPSMETRWYTLNTKYLIRLQTQPQDSLVYNLHQQLGRYHRLTLLQNKNTIYRAYQQEINTTTSITILNPKILKNIISTYQTQLITTSSEVMVKACSSSLSLDPILTLPMTRKERRRVLRWRMNWLPGRKQSCRCGGETSRNHILQCRAIPPSLWNHISPDYNENQIHPIDRLLKQLPTKHPTTLEEKKQLLLKWNPIWTDLLTILLYIDEICYQPQQIFDEEIDIGELLYEWIEHS